jgi:modified peptide precursor CbpA
MPSTVTTLNLANTNAATTENAASPAQAGGAKPAIIATRQRCEAEGVGLSHYILLDRKAAE